MIRLLFTLYFAVYPALTGTSAFCEDPVEQPGTGVEQTTAPEMPVPVQPAGDAQTPQEPEQPAPEPQLHEEGSKQYSGQAVPYEQILPEHGGDFYHGGGHNYRWDPNYARFRRNIHKNPETAARALLDFLDRLPPEKRERAISRNYSAIAELLGNLDKASASGRVSPEKYGTLTAALSRTLNNGGSDPALQSRGVGPDGHSYDRAFHPDSLPPPDQTSPGASALQSPDRAFQPNRVPPPGHRSQPSYGKPMDKLVDVRRALDSGDKQAAKKGMDELSAGYPENAGVQSALSRYYNDMHNYNMAAKSATNAIKLDPEDTEAYKNRARARASLQDRKGAIADVRMAMQLDPQDESAKLLSALMDSKKEITSLKTLSSLQEMRKTVGGAGASAAAAGRTSGGFSQAEAAAAAAHPVVPDYIRSAGYLKTAAAKRALRDYRNAAKYASMAIEKDPENTEAYLERANANNFLGRYDEAIRDTTDVISREPSNVQALNTRARALNLKGLAKEAETDVNHAIDINPEFAESWVNRALVYEKQGNYKRMLEDYRQAAALNVAYGTRFQDAVAQYSDRVPGFSPAPVPRGARSGTTHFLVLTGFTLTGGLLVAVGLLHIVTSSREKALADGKQSRPDILAPSIFYEGVASGKYKIERKIGQGGMGIVYEALDQSLGRTVAIKKMNEEIKVNEREKQRFLEEARTLAMLHHPNIVEIHTIFEEEKDIYLVCEHVSGLSLDKLLEKEVRLPFEKARTIFCEAAKALSYAHSKNVIHMDMKLSNIMISSDNEVKVMDFGLARHMKESLARVSSTEVVGSPAYMPPEQDLGVSSKESDIYAMGVCLYETLTGDLPFKGPDFHYQKEHRLYQPASEAVPGLPRGVDEFIARALSPDPESRFQTAGDFRRELLDIPAV